MGRPSLNRYIYQGILDYCTEFSINASDITAPIEPRISSPTPIDHEAMQPYFCWLPIERILNTFRHTSQMTRVPSLSYLRQ